MSEVTIGLVVMLLSVLVAGIRMGVRHHIWGWTFEFPEGFFRCEISFFFIGAILAEKAQGDIPAWGYLVVLLMTGLALTMFLAVMAQLFCWLFAPSPSEKEKS